MKAKFNVVGMHCRGCEQTLARQVRALPGVQEVKVSYPTGVMDVRFNSAQCDKRAIASAVKKAGYRVVKQGQDAHPDPQKARLAIGSLIILLAGYVLLRHFGLLGFLGSFPVAEAGMGYGVLFLIGLLTSVHCVAMCGGINLSQCLPGGEGEASLRPSLLYNLGRVVSYTVLGGIVGGLGSVISIGGTFRGVVQLVAGVFMVLMGLNLLDIIPWLRRITPTMPRFITRLVPAGRGKGPLVVGLLNGFMPCGPLQAMQLYALSTGSPLKGAASMLLFSLGTVPLMFGLGAISSVLSKKSAGRLMTVGASLVVVLGVAMLGNGIALSGAGQMTAFEPSVAESATDRATASQPQAAENDVQYITSELEAGRYPSVSLEADQKAEWNLHADKGTVNGCNYRVMFPAFDLYIQLDEGDNIIEIDPQEPGSYPYSCWMGMIQGSIEVMEI